MRAVVVEPLGDPEVLRVRDWPSPTPRPGQVLIKVSAAGVNFADIMGCRVGYLAAEPHSSRLEEGVGRQRRCGRGPRGKTMSA